jgi:eukaryotic-like serine/threonine-protein kinase
MVGKKINNYELRELVGDGAMGVVYLAEHPVLRRRAAVKLLKRQYLESPALITRFVNEARAAAAIHHPNVIEVIDVGMVDGDVPYIMMEYLDGEPLSRRLTRERLGVGKAVDITIQAARAVSASHALEIVHRDLKPENLFLVPDPTSPGGERVKVLDFGIAKLRPDWGGSDSPTTRTGVIFGTPAYMSPEQCRGLNAEVDGTTDIYALGCILYEMLCGKAPFTSPGWGDVLMMHMQEAIPIPSAANARVPASVDQVVVKAMAKAKGDRYTSMRDMHRALAQARGEVEDTPAPTHKTDPVLPAIVLGVEALAKRPLQQALDPLREMDSMPVPMLRPPNNRLRLAVAGGALALAAVVAIVLVSRRHAATAEAPRPPVVANPQPVSPPAPAPDPEAPAATAEDGATVEPGAKAKGKTKASRSSSSRHRSSKRRDPIKW